MTPQIEVVTQFWVSCMPCFASARWRRLDDGVACTAKRVVPPIVGIEHENVHWLVRDRRPVSRHKRLSTTAGRRGAVEKWSVSGSIVFDLIWIWKTAAFYDGIMFETR